MKKSTKIAGAGVVAAFGLVATVFGPSTVKNIAHRNGTCNAEMISDCAAVGSVGHYNPQQ